VWELDLPGENFTGFDATEVGDKPTACWWNLNTGWSYQPWEYKLKTDEEIVAAFYRARQMGAVFFLNVGPRPFGDIHLEGQHTLREIGQIIRNQGGFALQS
jgi:hypothetical protein